MNSKLFKDFIRDVGNLYYKTRLSSIEDCFIRLSQEVEQIDILDFVRWLGSEKKSTGKDSIRKNIAIPELFDVFNYLYDITVRFKSVQNDLGKFRKEVFNQNPRLIEIIATMNTLLDDYSVNSILLPFQSAIQLISKVFPIPPYDEAMVRRDLQVIIQAYGHRIEQQADTLKDLFIILLNRFSQDIGKALENIGRKDLADKVMSGKILYRPDLLSQILQVGNIDFVMGDKIRDIISNALHKNRNPDAIYEYIKKEALDFVGAIDKKQYDLQRDKDIEQGDLEEIQKGQGLQKSKGLPVDVTESQWLQPRSLAIISATLYALYKKIRG